MAEDAQTKEERRCGHCGGVIVCCEFCDGEECPKGVCYGCVIVALGEAVPQPHTHGG